MRKRCHRLASSKLGVCPCQPRVCHLQSNTASRRWGRRVTLVGDGRATVGANLTSSVCPCSLSTVGQRLPRRQFSCFETELRAVNMRSRQSTALPQPLLVCTSQLRTGAGVFGLQRMKSRCAMAIRAPIHLGAVYHYPSCFAICLLFTNIIWQKIETA